MAIRDLGDLADTLDRAADQLDEKIHQLRRIERNAQAWFASQVPPADGSQPRWVAEWWTYRPGRFPASGDSDWFAVASYLRARGVPV